MEVSNTEMENMDTTDLEGNINKVVIKENLFPKQIDTLKASQSWETKEERNRIKIYSSAFQTNKKYKRKE